jgi:hypothetical protein
MMKTLTQIGAVALLLVVLAARSASADTVAITAGSLQMDPLAGPLVLEGDRGFTFSSNVDVIGGIFMPWVQCTGLTCLPGGTVDLSGFWSGMDVTGTATLDGVSYPNVGAGSSLSSMVVHFSGAAILPVLATSAVLTAPFAFDGTFSHPGGIESLVGGGLATLFLSPDGGFPDRWHLDSARYDFTPTPEPATGVLLIVGIAVIERMRRRRAAH